MKGIELSTADVDQLLAGYASLTHRIHAYEREQGNGRGSATDDRAAREMIADEIKQRVEGKVPA